MTTARLLERIRKLLALTASPNANEAAVATSKARKLMAEHGFTEQEVLDSEQAGKVFELSMGAEGFASRWKFVLVALVARSQGCEAIGLRRGKLRKVRLVGIKSDVEQASRLFEHLLGEIERLVKIECASPPDEILFEVARGTRRSLRAYLDSFRRGVVTALAARLRGKESHQGQGRGDAIPRPRDHGHMSRSLAVAVGAKPSAREHIEARYPKTTYLPLEDACDGIDELAFFRGHQAGMGIVLGAST
jgi:Protein of unknown function (DUF2786)